MDGGDGGVIFEGAERLLLHHGREVLRPGAGRRARRAHISRLDEVLGHDEPGARGPRGAHLRADLARRAAAVPGVVQQSRGPAAGGSSAAPLRVLEGAAGAHVREQRKACLHGASGQRLGSLHDCAWRRNQTFLAIIAARCESSAATSSSELSELARSRCSMRTF